MAHSARIESLYSGSVSVVLSGEFDIASVPLLAEKLKDALTMSPHLVVDLHEVTFLDAAMLSTLLAAQHQALTRDGSLVLVGATPWVEKVLRASRVLEAIPLLPDPRDPRTSKGTGSLMAALRNRRTIC